MPTKPRQAERINPFPTTLFSVPTKSVQTEQANLFPTGVRRKIQHRTCVTRGKHGFHRTLEPGNRNMQLALPGCVAVTVSSIVPNRATGDNRIGSCLNSPLKLRL